MSFSFSKLEKHTYEQNRNEILYRLEPRLPLCKTKTYSIYWKMLGHLSNMEFYGLHNNAYK